MEIIKAKGFKLNIIELLKSENLPTDGITDDLENFLIAIENNVVCGAIGMEIYGKYALIRSLVVKNDSRNEGLAGRLILNVEDHAIKHEVIALFLLTETASTYFNKKGFNEIARTEVPIEVQQSIEFRYLCPQSAIVMKKSVVK